MKTNGGFFCILIFSLILNTNVSHANIADTTITTLNNVHQGNGSGLGTRTVIDTFLFPQDISMYSNIEMRITLSCPTGGCDPWDRFANVSVFNNGEWYEIGRYITPYGKACGWLADVSDYRNMLKDTVIIRSFIDTWTNPGWLVKLDFEFTAGITLYDNIKVENLWYNENLVYGDAINPPVLPVVNKTVDVNSQIVKFKMVNTGHGQGNTDNAAEFSQKIHSLYVNGVETNTHLLWRSNCATNPCSPQSGTWQFNRAGWCPGADVLPVFFDLTTITSPGQSIDLEYRLQNYLNYCSPNNPSCITGTTCADCNYNYNGHTEPHYKISGQLITYLNTGTGTDGIKDFDKLTITPNPTSGLIRLNFINDGSSGRVFVYDIVGNLIYERSVSGKNVSLDLNGFAAGTYILKFSSAERVLTRKVFKL